MVVFRRSEARDEEVREGSKKGKEVVEHRDHPIWKERKREVVEVVNMVICMKC